MAAMSDVATDGPSEAKTLDDHICFAFYSASIAINRMYKPLLDQLGITYPQFLVLSALWEKDGQSIGAIADRLSLESSTITPLVKRLEQAGFMTRHRNTSDERQVHVQLTQKGREVQAGTGCMKDQMIAQSGLSADEIIRLNSDVRCLVNALTGVPAETAPEQDGTKLNQRKQPLF